MKRIQIQFLQRLILISVIIFGVHILVLDLLGFSLFENKIILAYVVNIGVALLVFNVLYFFREKFKKQLGFLFLFGSVLKFALFFILFNGAYRADGEVSGFEFSAFFIPYAITLIVEVYSLAKWLNKLE
ncbi:hypothetical protein RQM59_03020 [Flavobacteriaceae bacterium S356]|uniref:ATP synthase protein I n=1 Tax=Asprobacillus argus TaxID=3076534 RepID=A0ABU3LCL4_9FLAO|nr:hypothetical protein [Flavobacteriaceae bacterium S356]